MGRQNPGCSEILVRAEIEPRKKKKRCLLREIKDLKGERIHLRFCELAINLVVRFLFFSFFSFCIAFFLISPFHFFLPTTILPPIIANLSDLWCSTKSPFILPFLQSITRHYYLFSPFNVYFKSNLILNSRNTRISFGMSRRQIRVSYESKVASVPGKLFSLPNASTLRKTNET